MADLAESLGNRRNHWGGLHVTDHKGTIKELGERLPQFSVQPLSVKVGQTSHANPRLLTVVRKPMNDTETPIPVGVVSTSYQLVQHHKVLDVACNAIKGIGVDLDKIEASVRLTENGERMVLNILFPDNDTYSMSLNGNGDQMRLRLQCFNSVDGGMRFMAFLGWFRFVCSNGLVIGLAKVDIRRLHRSGFDVTDVGLVLSHSLSAISHEKAIYRQWMQTAVPPEKMIHWVDGPVRKLWGAKTAARAAHIAQSGHDGKFEDPFERAKPSERRMVSLEKVPGILAPCRNAFQFSQILSWLAKERNDVQEQIERMQQISTLMKDLLKKTPGVN
jgi:hypothetical protein